MWFPIYLSDAKTCEISVKSLFLLLCCPPLPCHLLISSHAHVSIQDTPEKLCSHWDAMCESYVNNIKTVMQQLRSQHTMINHHLYNMRYLPGQWKDCAYGLLSVHCRLHREALNLNTFQIGGVQLQM